ncbi:MAG: polysaccharide deacetylase family protein [Veillonellales bacterium]
MIRNSSTFRTLCVGLTFFLTLLISSPLITLAFYLDSAAFSPAIDSASSDGLDSAPAPDHPDAYYLAENNMELPPGDQPFYDTLTVAERQAGNLPTQLPVLPPYYGEKVVYLTFDDGPDPQNTPEVLQILKDNGIKATFFVVGTQVEKFPDVLQMVYQDGHAIGNHSYNHIYRQLYQSPASYTGQLHRTDEIIKNVIGVRPHISRAPGGSVGSFTKAYWELLKQEGYLEEGWNVSSGDASSAKAEQLVGNIVYQMDNKFLWSHAIVLMHDGSGHGETVKALPEIIKFFKEHGFTFRVINAQTPPPW